MHDDTLLRRIWNSACGKPILIMLLIIAVLCVLRYRNSPVKSTVQITSGNGSVTLGSRELVSTKEYALKEGRTCKVPILSELEFMLDGNAGLMGKHDAETVRNVIETVNTLSSSKEGRFTVEIPAGAEYTMINSAMELYTWQEQYMLHDGREVTDFNTVIVCDDMIYHIYSSTMAGSFLGIDTSLSQYVEYGRLR